jgi:hypothetical protein
MHERYLIEASNFPEDLEISNLSRYFFFCGKWGVFFYNRTKWLRKSTLVQIIAGLQKPSEGKLAIKLNGKEILESLWSHIGFASPAMNLYERLTVYENASFAFRGRISL